MKKDFLIVGQGIAGSLLSWELIKQGYSIEIWDQGSSEISSMKAAGLFNPITGRSLSKTWMADEIFPPLIKFYQNLETTLEAKFIHEIPIYRPFTSYKDQNEWAVKYTDNRFRFHIESLTQSLNISGLHDEYGGLILKGTGFVDLPSLLRSMKCKLNPCIKLRNFEDRDLKEWQDVADKILFCEGPFTTKNIFWNTLPFRLVRGEVIDIQCDLIPNYIYNRGVFMIPFGDTFRIGSTYDQKKLSFEPQHEGLQELQKKLKKLYSGKYDIVDARAGIRPATHDRKPYIGWHPENKKIGIFNGFGTKGVSLVPYFSKLFVNSIEEKKEIHFEANVSRVF